MGLDATFYRTVSPSVPASADAMQLQIDYFKSCGVYDPMRVTSWTESVYDFRKFNGLERFMKTHRLHRLPLDSAWLDLMASSADRAIDKADELSDSEYLEWSQQHNPLRPMSGFFFGSTDYTSVYFNHLQKLINVCRSMSEDIKNGNALYYTYESSW